MKINNGQDTNVHISSNSDDSDMNNFSTTKFPLHPRLKPGIPHNRISTISIGMEECKCVEVSCY